MSVKSPLGAQLCRAEMFSTDSDGNPIPKATKSWTEMRVNETRFTPSADHQIAEIIDGAKVWARLTELERCAWRIYQESSRLGKERVITCAAGDRFRHFGRGYRFVRSLPAQQLPDGTVLEEVELAGRESTPLSWERIGGQLGVHAVDAQRAYSRAKRKLRTCR